MGDFLDRATLSDGQSVQGILLTQARLSNQILLLLLEGPLHNASDDFVVTVLIVCAGAFPSGRFAMSNRSTRSLTISSVLRWCT